MPVRRRPSPKLLCVLVSVALTSTTFGVLAGAGDAMAWKSYGSFDAARSGGSVLSCDTNGTSVYSDDVCANTVDTDNFTKLPLDDAADPDSPTSQWGTKCMWDGLRMETQGNFRHYRQAFDTNTYVGKADACSNNVSVTGTSLYRFIPDGGQLAFRARLDTPGGCAQIRYEYDGPSPNDFTVKYLKITGSGYSIVPTGVYHRFYDANGNGTIDQDSSAERGYRVRFRLENTAYSGCNKAPVLSRFGWAE